jgi:hypothetical protein
MKTPLQKRSAAGKKAHEVRKRMDAVREAKKAKCSTTNEKEAS